MSFLLTPAVAKQAPREVDWTTEREDAFNHLCSKLHNFWVLTIPLPSDVYKLHTNASALGPGGSL